METCEIPLWAPGRIYIAGLVSGTYHLAAFRSDDLGETWEEISDGLPQAHPASAMKLTSAPDRGRIYLHVEYPLPPRFLMKEEPMPAEVSERPGAPVARILIRPNPAMGRVRIEAQRTSTGSPAGARSSEPLEIFAPSGRHVRSLRASEQPGTGASEYDWDVRDERGDPVPTGVYFVRAAGGDLPGGRILVLR